jgi:hypothetical protein
VLCEYTFLNMFFLFLLILGLNIQDLWKWTKVDKKNIMDFPGKSTTLPSSEVCESRCYYVLFLFVVVLFSVCYVVLRSFS